MQVGPPKSPKPDLSNPDMKDCFPLSVSALIPAHNAAAVLARAVQSVQAQTFTDWEIIIADDGSGDATHDIALDLAKSDPRIRVVHSAQNQGAAVARNKALGVAQGRYIAFLDADDVWHADKLALQLAHMQRHNAGLSYTGFWRRLEDQQQQVHVPAQASYQHLQRGNCIGCLTAVYDRAVYGNVPMPDLPLAHDYALWLTLLKQGGVAYGLDEPLATYHVTQGSLSANKWRALQAIGHMHHRHFGHNMLQAGFYTASHILRRLRSG